jgi:hypothetical protein
MKTSIFKNSNKNIVRISALKYFVASWGLPGRLLGVSGDLVCNIINKEANRKPTRSPKKLPGSYKTFRAEILTIFFMLFWKIDVLINLY